MRLVGRQLAVNSGAFAQGWSYLWSPIVAGEDCSAQKGWAGRRFLLPWVPRCRPPRFSSPLFHYGRYPSAASVAVLSGAGTSLSYVHLQWLRREASRARMLRAPWASILNSPGLPCMRKADSILPLLRQSPPGPPPSPSDPPRQTSAIFMGVFLG
jgi:hypothetical protein